MILVKAEGLKRVCPDGIEIKDISFEISEKGIYGFLTKNASEKSELARLLAGISEPDGGELIYKERAMLVSDKQTAQIKKKIGYVPQKCFFDQDMTVFEALDFVGKAKSIDPDKRFRQIKEALELTGISNRKNTLVSALSISETRKLSLAASLLGNPDVVIMDDPLRSLDKVQSQNVSRVIELLGTKKVVLLLSTRPSEIEELCAHVAIIANGELAVWGEVEEILKKMNASGFSGLADALDAFSDIVEEE